MNNVITRKRVQADASLKAAYNNARRRLKYAEKRYEAAEAASDAANDAADQARHKVQSLLVEVMRSMDAVDAAKPRKSKGEVSRAFVDDEMSMPVSTLAANKGAKSLSSTSISDAMESAWGKV